MAATVTVGGACSEAVASFNSDASALCQKHQLMQAGQLGDVSNGCTTEHVDVPTDAATNQACIDGAAVDWQVYWSASAGDPYDAGGGSASTSATCTIAATPTP